MLKKTTLSQRINTGLALAMVFLLVLATNQIDQLHFEKAQDSLNTIFRNRVITLSHIHKISSAVTAKSLQLQNIELVTRDDKANKQLKQLVEELNNTKLTTEEKKYHILLQNDVKELVNLEKLIFDRQYASDPKIITPISAKLVQINNTLDTLVAIQLRESKNVSEAAQKSLKVIKLISNVEIGILLIVGIALQFIIFYNTGKARV